MLKDDLKCVLIGREVEIYPEVAKLVRTIDPTSRFKQVDLKESAIIDTLKKINGPSLIFISDEVPFSLELLSDLIWQYNADTIVVILTTKARTVSIKELFNNTQFSRINLTEKNSHSASILQFLIQSTREKTEFRRCKSLLGISEKRCQWLVDSSREAISFISRDVHWYANAAYLELFGIATIQELRTISIKDIIIEDEHLLFDGFQKNQGNATEQRQSIILSMKKSNNASFRANVYLIPSVFKGHKCHQLWVREINALSSTEETKEDLTTNLEIKESKNSSFTSESDDQENPFDVLLNTTINDGSVKNQIKDTVSSSQSTEKREAPKAPKKQKRYDEHSLLRGVIRRKEARVVVTPLTFLKENENRTKAILKHNMVSLKVASAQKKGVDDLLMKLPDSFNKKKRSVFWDKVKLSRILQTLVNKNQLPMSVLIQVSEASVIDDQFIDWMIPGLKRLGSKNQNLVFLIPSNIDESYYEKTLIFIKKLRELGCNIALDSFSVNKKSLILLKYAKPQYVRLSLPWTRQIQGDDLKEMRLSSAIRLFENKKIKVIAPCGFSKDIKKLFIHSGASFCQESTIKPAQ